MKPEILIHRYLLGDATEAEVQELDRLLAADPDLRRKLIFEASTDAGLREIALERVSMGAAGRGAVRPNSKTAAARFFPMAAAAAVAFVLGLGIMHFGVERKGKERTAEPGSETIAAGPLIEPLIEPLEGPSAEGFAVIESLFEAEWVEAEVERRQADSLGAELLQLRAGVAEVQFFSGATMVIQGPAEVELSSAWEARCNHGVLRMRVPPAARGFKLHGPQTEIVDLGTEFGFEVTDGQAHVEVIDGEISFKHRAGKQHTVREGGSLGIA